MQARTAPAPTRLRRIELAAAQRCCMTLRLEALPDAALPGRRARPRRRQFRDHAAGRSPRPAAQSRAGRRGSCGSSCRARNQDVVAGRGASVCRRPRTWPAAGTAAQSSTDYGGDSRSWQSTATPMAITPPGRVDDPHCRLGRSLVGSRLGSRAAAGTDRRLESHRRRTGQPAGQFPRSCASNADAQAGLAANDGRVAQSQQRVQLAGGRGADRVCPSDGRLCPTGFRAGRRAGAIAIPEPKAGPSAAQLGQPHAAGAGATSSGRDRARLEAGRHASSKTRNFAQHTLGRFRLSTSDDVRAAELAATPATIVAVLRVPAGQRSAEQSELLAKYYRSIAPELASRARTDRGAEQTARGAKARHRADHARAGRRASGA